MQKLAKRRDEQGMTTAEYAVGTVATVSIVGVLLSIISNPEFRKFLSTIIEALLDIIIKMITGG
jgi:Flp pilus assembly pilin Flp